MNANDDASLLPPVRVLHDRLSRNERERRVLRTLLRLALDEMDDREKTTGPPRDKQRKGAPACSSH